MTKKKPITSIGFWCFIFAIGIGIDYLNIYIWRDTEHLIFTGGKFLSFFILLAGYILMDHYQKSKKDKEKDCPSISAWKYAGKKYSALYPSLLGGVTLAFIVRNIISKTKLSSIIPIFMDSIWEFLGISQIGAVGLFEQTTGAVLTSPGTSSIWNTPLWVISAIIISSLFLYYIVSKSEDFFGGIFAPIFIIITYASLGLSTNGWSHTALGSIGLPCGLARVMAGMSIGMLLYYVVYYLRKREFGEAETICLSLIHIVLIMIFIYTWYYGFTWNELTSGLLMCLFLVVLLTDKDYISDLYNNSKIGLFLGKLSLYYYSCFFAFIFFLSWLFPEMSYHASILFNILFSSCWAFIMMYFDDYIITPIFRRNKKDKIKKDKKKIA